MAKLRIGEETYLVMGEVGIRNDGRPYYDQRVVAKLKADSASILRDGIETESAFDEVYDNRFRILMQASRAFALEKKRGHGSGADRGTGDRAAEPVVKKDGSVGCVRFEGAKATRTRSEDGREIVLIEGMTGEEMMRPENRDAAVQFVTRLKEMAGDVDLVFADVSAADAVEALLMAARVRARASSVSGDTIAGSGDLVSAGQRLVDGLFGEKSGIRVRTGTPEEAEAALRAADGEGRMSKGRSPREDPLESNIRERLKFGKNYDPADSHHLAYSWKEIALYHDMGNGEYAILERLPNTKRGYERLREKIGRTYAGRVRDDIDRVVGLARDLARSHRLRLHDAGRGQEGDVRDAGVASRHEGDGAGEVDRQGEGAGERRLLKNDQGEVQGYYDRGKGEVVLFEGADAGTLAHEIGWHAVWHWAERNSPDLLLKMKRYAARTPLKLKALIKEVYGDFKGDALMDEIGAGRFERAMGERFQKLLAKSPEVRGWWRKVLHALARAWKGMARTVGGNRVDLKKIEKMDPEEAIEALTAQMLEGRRLGEGRGNAEGDIRPSIGGIYTGTAADYANRSRQGGVDDGPSVKKIGTGEGSQVYGWGLYGSNVRGVAENYMPRERTAEEKAHIEFLKRSVANETQPALKKYWEDQLRLAQHPQRNLYEQTFFTDRAPGDESHLLKWYDAISDANWDRVIAQAEKEGLREKLKGAWWLRFNGDLEHFITDNGNSGDAIYESLSRLLGSPQAASEFLYRAGIDGVKYPVDSYGGKGVKDGDTAGWNYVAFSDEHIRVDHKWTEGEMRYARKLNGAKAREVAENMETAGASREEIWEKTGWWRGKDG